jgi:hypothetical protein
VLLRQVQLGLRKMTSGEKSVLLQELFDVIPRYTNRLVTVKGYNAANTWIRIMKEISDEAQKSEKGKKEKLKAFKQKVKICDFRTLTGKELAKKINSVLSSKPKFEVCCLFLNEKGVRPAILPMSTLHCELMSYVKFVPPHHDTAIVRVAGKYFEFDDNEARVCQLEQVQASLISRSEVIFYQKKAAKQ